MIKTLQYFVRYDRQDAVQIGVVVSLDGLPDSTTVITGSDTALVAAAEASGHSTWDEDTICAVHGLVRAPVAA